MLTTDELVAKVLEALRDPQWQGESGYRWLIPHMNSVDTQYRPHYIREVFSVALNDETYDVRYVEFIFFTQGEDPIANEVFPVTVVKTEYRRK